MALMAQLSLYTSLGSYLLSGVVQPLFILLLHFSNRILIQTRCKLSSLFVHLLFIIEGYSLIGYSTVQGSNPELEHPNWNILIGTSRGFVAVVCNTQVELGPLCHVA